MDAAERDVNRGRSAMMSVENAHAGFARRCVLNDVIRFIADSAIDSKRGAWWNTLSTAHDHAIMARWQAVNAVIRASEEAARDCHRGLWDMSSGENDQEVLASSCVPQVQEAIDAEDIAASRGPCMKVRGEYAQAVLLRCSAPHWTRLRIADADIACRRGVWTMPRHEYDQAVLVRC